ncbi:alpha-(1-_3)-arabinofuranosyltransferase domain-containing protein [Actinokineospora sp.]|uniref:alpha-(1->3)-arabinofuranosyltransferase domain-containing protein n=1 Tax=Actinokineospora sp. TaxID=1872133 RepID=UPI004037D8F1
MSELASEPGAESSYRLRGKRSVAMVARLRAVACCALLTAVAFLQAPGKIVGDTKLDLVVDPGAFLARALSLWDPAAELGRLQNQANGYLFPMGPFFGLGQLAAVPPWIVQRAWMAALLVLAFLGARRVATLLNIGSPNTRLIGALVYALAPRALTLLGTNSAELLPTSVLPWVLAPLIAGSRTGSTRKAAALSALALLFAGGINAAAVFAILLVPAVWLLTRPRGPRRNALMAWWALGVGLAVTWWLAPLPLLGRYGFPFVPYTETASATTSAGGLVDATRGTTNWVTRLVVDGQTWWPGGAAVGTGPILIVLTAVIAAIGLSGLLRFGMPERRFLVFTAVLGVILLSAGHLSDFSAPWSAALQNLLDGPAGPLRNLHKFDPLVRLPLALGVAYVLGQPWPAERSVVATGGTALALLGLVTTAVSTQVITPGPFADIPPYWREATSWLDRNADRGATLALPAAPFGEYQWGRTMDDPMQSLMAGGWLTRALVPPGSPGLARTLSALDELVTSGRGSPGLAEVLGRTGVRYLLVRNDTNLQRTPYVEPGLLRASLDASPGIVRVAGFGPVVGGRAGPDVLDNGLFPRMQALEVYRVDAYREQVVTYDMADLVRVLGAPESMLQLSDAGLADRPVLLGADDPDRRVPTITTDTLLRREVEFGRARENVSAPLGPGEQPRSGRRVTDLLDPAWADSDSRISYGGGLAAVSASSSASDAAAVGLPKGLEFQPFAAVDGDPSTSWISSGDESVVGQWLDVVFDGPKRVGEIDVTMLDSGLVDRAITGLRVSTDSGDVEVSVAGPGKYRVRLPGPTTRLRVTVTGTRLSGPGRVGITDIDIPGVDPVRTVTLPTATGVESVLLSRRPQVAPCVATEPYWACGNPLGGRSAEPGELRREFDADFGSPPEVTAFAQPVPGPGLDEVVFGRMGVVANSSSLAYQQPAASPYAAVDGDLRTVWLAGREDRTPTLDLAWGRQATLTGLRLRMPDAVAASVPVELELRAGEEVRYVTVPASGDVAFAPLVTNRLRIKVAQVAPLSTVDVHTGGTTLLPVGIGELKLDGMDFAPAPRADEVVELACGQAGRLLLDGQAVPLAAEPTVRSLLALEPLPVRPCAPLPDLSAGRHTLRADAGVGVLTPTTVLLGRPLPAERRGRPAIPLTWAATSRSVVVGPGDEQLLVVRENHNPGWEATLDGQILQPIRIDGWQQAWVLPQGAGGEVRLTYRPNTTYLVLLGVGAVFLLVLIGLFAWPVRRTPPADPRRAGVRWPPWLCVPVGFVLAGFAGLGVAVVVYAVRRTWLFGRLRPHVVAPVAAVAAGLCQAVATGRDLALTDLRGELPASLVGWLGDGVPQLLCAFAWVVVCAAAVSAEPPALTDDLDDQVVYRAARHG